MQRRIKHVLLLVLFLNAALFAVAGGNGQVGYRADTTLLKNYMRTIVGYGYRNYRNTAALDKTADFIKSKFQELTDSVWEQRYEVGGKTYRNVIASLHTEKRERIVVGAHYDVCGEVDGADDNASGVVGLIRLAQLMSRVESNYRIDFVAYTLEEPPFYRADSMGSFIHAYYLKKNNIALKGMICIESIGYFSEEKNSQTYSYPLHKYTLGRTADFILVVSRNEDGLFGKQITSGMKKGRLIRAESVRGLKRLKGVDQSDHRNYWRLGFPAVMITNTCYYRNKNYHQPTDTIGTIDFSRMAAVVHQLGATIQALP